MAEWWQNQETVSQVYEEAEKGNTAAQCELARMLMQEQRMEEAIRWYKQAASQGASDAMFNLGVLYSQGWDGAAPDAEQSYFWYESAAKKGDREAMYMVGSCKLKGAGTEKDEQGAAKWLKQSLHSGYSLAQELLYTIPGMKAEREAQLQSIRSIAEQAEQYLQYEDYEKAIPLLQQAVSESTKKLGEMDACTLSLMNNLGVALAGEYQFAESIPLKEHLLELRGKCLPVTHPDYLTAVINLTSDYAKVGRYQSAVNLSKQAYAAARESLPISHELTLKTLNRLVTDYMNLSRHDLALEQLKMLDLVDPVFSAPSDPALEAVDQEKVSADHRMSDDRYTAKALEEWQKATKLRAVCKDTVEKHQIYFNMAEQRRAYAWICAELCEMLDGMPEDYRERIRQDEYLHYKEQADLVGCYHHHLHSGHAVETDPYTNALQTLVSLKYLMPPVAECIEELDGLTCRAVVTWIQNELCLIATVYPEKSVMEHMEHPQPADFVKPLNTCEYPGEKVLALDSMDLQMKTLENGLVQISFAYGSGKTLRMLRMYFNRSTGQLDGETVFRDIR